MGRQWVLLIFSLLLNKYAFAFPNGIQNANFTNQPSVTVTVRDYFEGLIGRSISSKEEDHISNMIAQTEQIQLQPQLVSTFGGTEVVPLICGQFKANFSWAKGIGGEINPCFDPTSGKSYIMKGTSMSSAGSVSTALLGGVYVGPSSATPVIGQYGFFSATKEIFPFIRAHMQVSASLNCIQDMISLSNDKSLEQKLKNCQFLAFGGLGFNISDIFNGFKAKIFNKAPGTAAISVAGVEASVGVVFSINEFPWYERLKQGHSVREAFSGWDTYAAR